MKILFVHSIYDIFSPAKPLRSQAEIHFGISYISSVLKKHGHSIKLIVLSRMLGKKNEKMVDEYIKRFSPRIIGFTAINSEYPFIANMAKYIKGRYPHIYLLAGGIYVSLNPEQAISDDFDAICVGEGEYPMLELVSQLEKRASPGKIPNLWIKRGVEIEKNSTRPFQGLDNLPFPDREIWQEWIGDYKSQISVMLNRGCPFECTYCCNHAFKKLAKGSYVRFRSCDNIVEEVKDITIKFPEIKEVYLEIEAINIKQKWALELCSKLEYLNKQMKKPLSFGVNLRIMPNMDLKNLFATFKKSNFKFLNIGLESGSEKVRRDILKRNYSNQDAINAVNMAREYGLKINLYNLVGIPGETIDDFNETIRINRICQPDNTATSIFFPYQGTELYRICKDQSLLKKANDRVLERCEATLDLPSFSKKQIEKNFIWFDYYVYKGHRPIYKILAKVLVAKFRSNPFLFYVYRRSTYTRFFKWFKHMPSLKSC